MFLNDGMLTRGLFDFYRCSTCDHGAMAKPRSLLEQVLMGPSQWRPVKRRLDISSSDRRWTRQKQSEHLADKKFVETK